MTIPPPVIAAEGRVMLIEELTGVKCGPCAAGAILLEEILNANKGSIVAYAIHGQLLSEPHSNSKYDFRNEDSKTLEVSLVELIGKPSITFNRVALNGVTRVQAQPNTWQPFVDTELLKSQVANVDVTADFDEVTRLVTINIGVSALEDLNGLINLHVAISESHLIDPQQDGNDIIEDFEHMHVLKDMLSVITGDFLTEDLAANITIPRQYTYEIPEENNGEWTPKNIEVTAFITSEDLDGEVLQAAQVHVTE